MFLSLMSKKCRRIVRFSPSVNLSVLYVFWTPMNFVYCPPYSPQKSPFPKQQPSHKEVFLQLAFSLLNILFAYLPLIFIGGVHIFPL